MNTLLTVLGWWLVTTVVLFVFYVLIVKAQQFVEGRSKWVRFGVILHGWPIGIAGILLDAFYNWTWGVLLFLDLPRSNDPDRKIEWLLTWRLNRYLDAGPVEATWRWYLAYRICQLLNRLDPGHCHE